MRASSPHLRLRPRTSNIADPKCPYLSGGEDFGDSIDAGLCGMSRYRQVYSICSKALIVPLV